MKEEAGAVLEGESFFAETVFGMYGVKVAV